jgi:hypothetical protein
MQLISVWGVLDSTFRSETAVLNEMFDCFLAFRYQLVIQRHIKYTFERPQLSKSRLNKPKL